MTYNFIFHQQVFIPFLNFVNAFDVSASTHHELWKLMIENLKIVKYFFIIWHPVMKVKLPRDENNFHYINLQGIHN